MNDLVVTKSFLNMVVLWLCQQTGQAAESAKARHSSYNAIHPQMSTDKQLMCRYVKLWPSIMMLAS